MGVPANRLVFTRMSEISIIGIDLAKHSFQMHGAAADDSVVFRRKVLARRGS